MVFGFLIFDVILSRRIVIFLVFFECYYVMGVFGCGWLLEWFSGWLLEWFSGWLLEWFSGWLAPGVILDDGWFRVVLENCL